MRFAVRRRLDRRDKGRLAIGPASDGTGTLAAEIGVVHLNLAFQPLRRVALQHDLFELVLHFPGGVLCDPEPPRQFQTGDALFGLREVIHGGKPQAQRQLARREDGSRPHRGLLAADVALEKFARSPPDDAMRPAAAVGAFEALRPAPFDQRRVALLLVAIGLVERGLAKTFLKLHFVARHRRSLPKTICSLFVLSENQS